MILPKHHTGKTVNIKNRKHVLKITIHCTYMINVTLNRNFKIFTIKKKIYVYFRQTLLYMHKK